MIFSAFTADLFFVSKYFLNSLLKVQTFLFEMDQYGWKNQEFALMSVLDEYLNKKNNEGNIIPKTVKYKNIQCTQKNSQGVYLFPVHFFELVVS
jgi:hypothetical protein